MNDIRRLLDACAGFSDRLLDLGAQLETENRELESRTRNQSDSISAITEAISRTTGSVAKQRLAAAVNIRAVESASFADEGVTITGQAIHSIEAISQSSGRISEMLNVIHDIAFQTNLLALNAAVEARTRAENRARFCGRGRRSPQSRPAFINFGQGY
jgi:methyl-accepting chemotaxis protein